MNKDLVKYYLEHKSEFFTDRPHSRLLDRLKKLIKKYDTDKTIVGIDVGCNLGAYIRHLKKFCKEPNSKILCFEPNPVNIPVIEKKIKSEKNIKLFKFALSNVNGTFNFYNWKDMKKNKVGNPIGGLRSGGDFICKTEVKLLQDVLDEEFKDQDILIKFLKIDVEGNDTNVIKGFEKYLDRTEYIIFECSDCLDDFRGPGIERPMKDIVDYLSNNNFDTYRIGKKKLIKVNDEYWDDTYEKIKYWSNCFSLKKDNNLINSLIDENFNYLI